ncbi:DUF547 domain-containing protein [Nevskia sp.]|uniref:DUF547 domain-containing protein n=1 Tax=Nevskia sp. TaxID=1929292 RepID=UPI0025DA82EB|nr:DUF547 domain-containing protein [Nevskia sp.]
MIRILLALLLTALPLTSFAFDASHDAWTRLLQKHVVDVRPGQATAVRYAGFAADRPALKAYLASLSAVKPDEYGRWTKPEQLAFLINAYNAWTVELILGSYPKLKSIKDLGSLLSSPWKKTFIPLLGQTISLDQIEHGMIRKPGVFDDPRIHAAVNCASVGCPALARSAFVARDLDRQLDAALSGFLSDATRNRYDAASGRLEVSKIFDWYSGDFERGHRGYDSLKTLFAKHAAVLARTSDGQAAVRAGRYKLGYLDYDWALNDAR